MSGRLGSRVPGDSGTAAKCQTSSVARGWQTVPVILAAAFALKAAAVTGRVSAWIVAFPLEEPAQPGAPPTNAAAKSPAPAAARESQRPLIKVPPGAKGKTQTSFPPVPLLGCRDGPPRRRCGRHHMGINRM